MSSPDRHPLWLEYAHVSSWLATATKGLSDESKARVHDEIIAHFHDALDEGMRARLTEEQAVEQAVTSLGSPKAAQRAFRRTYLTHRQAYAVHSFTDDPGGVTSSISLWAVNRRRRLFMAPFMVAGVAAMTALNPRLGTRQFQLCIVLVALMVAATIVLAAVPRLFRRGRERAAIALGASAEFSLWGALIIAPALNPSHTLLGVRLSLLVAYAVATAAYYLPLLRKLSKYREAT